MFRSTALPALALLTVSWLLTPAQDEDQGRTRAAPTRVLVDDGSSGCLTCHTGIEAMHPEANLSCVECHGGNAMTRKKLEAHVRSMKEDPGDERVAHPKEDLAWRRFRNPMDLRVAEQTCGGCHEDMVRHLMASLHGTTAGHLSDGFYEMGLTDDKKSVFSIFPLPDYYAEPGDIDGLDPIPPFRGHGRRDKLSTHFADLPRKECMQCHLWSEGRAVQGRVGFDGDYRGEGCAACHVSYALDGLSDSADRAVNRNEPGHPRAHTMTRAPTVETCSACHYGDASIGLHFRGLSQLPPGAPGGPEIPGTTDQLLNRTFYLNDAAMCPPDVHGERGMACIDCHTLGDVMGDGVLHGAMERAVEISCSDCHGTFSEPATLRTARGTPLEHVRRVGDDVILTSKVTGAEHEVPQAVHILDRDLAEYNPDAALAMTKVHEKLECYTCHAGWNVNFVGFHFDRNESLSQLDLISGVRTPGRVTTQEKVFSTWKSFFAGKNEAGRVAPYLTGFSTMGTVRDQDGVVIVDQQMPETAAGLSGMTMVHHQLHSTRPTARSCVECHRSSATWGLGSVNFKLGRQLAFVADRRGIEVVAVQRSQLSASAPVAKFVLPDVVDLELDCDPLQGHARRLFASEGHRGVHVLDVSDPIAPERSSFTATINPRGMALAGDHLYLADGVGGLKVLDVSKDEPEVVAVVPMFDAHDVFVQWPYAYVADGPGGLVIVDVRKPTAPALVGGTKLAHSERVRDAAVDVKVLFQYSRPVAVDDEPTDYRTQARALAAVLDENEGLVLVDVTEPTRARVVFPVDTARSRTQSRSRENLVYTGLALGSHVDLAEAQGGSRTRERDYAYLLAERTINNGQQRSVLVVVDVTDPPDIRQVGTVQAGNATEMLNPVSFYNPPFLQTVMFAPGDQGVFAMDVSVSAEPRQLGAIGALRRAYVVAVEEFPLDKMLDEAGRQLKDVSHADSRWMNLREIERLMLVPGEILGTVQPGVPAPEIAGITARLHFLRNDRDFSGVLEGEELEGPLASSDENGDGRLTLSELEGIAGLSLSDETAVLAEQGSVFLRTRTDADGDLARLLDGTNPFEFDVDRDRRLDRREMGRSVFAALDLDGDERLTLDELSRYPGELRQLRYRGALADKLLDEVDDNRDRRISPREFALAERDWEAMDTNRDGFVHLGEPPNPWLEERGFPPAGSEWPKRQPYQVALPPIIEEATFVAAFDTNGDGELTAREMKRRRDLFIDMDRDGSGRVTPDEYRGFLNAVAVNGVEVTLDSFAARWDLNGDGKVEPQELPQGVELTLSTRR